MPACQIVDISFLDTAAEKIVNIVEVKATPEEIFSVFEDENAWPEWFDGIDKVTWTSEKPYGVDATRTLKLGPMTVWEHFFIWEQNNRFAFYFSKTSLPFVKALLEVYELEVLDENTTRFTYTVAYTPRLMLALSGPLGKFALRRNFGKAAKAFVLYMEKKNAAATNNS